MTRIAAALLALGCVCVLGAPPASASCAAPVEPVQLADHELVFAGEVTGTSHDGRAAEVRVLDVWRGRDLPAEVVVIGGDVAGNGHSSTERVFRGGETYAFFAYEDEEGVLRDNACTATAPLAERAAVDPPGVRAPTAEAPTPEDPRTSPWPWVVGGSGLVLAGGAGLALKRRRT